MLTQKHVNDLHSMLTGTKIPKARSKSAQVAAFAEDIEKAGIKMKVNELQSMDFDTAKAALGAAITEAKLEIPGWLKRTPENEAEKTAARKAAAKAAKDGGKPKKDNKGQTGGKESGKNKPKAGDGVRGKRSAHSGKKIHLKVKKNPYRAGSKGFDHFQPLLDAKPAKLTFEQWMEAGGLKRNIAWDIRHGHIEIK